MNATGLSLSKGLNSAGGCKGPSARSLPSPPWVPPQREQQCVCSCAALGQQQGSAGKLVCELELPSFSGWILLRGR
eukprot:scaffold1402_cov403-Prasinococcus_capsulatus_cf.AAC.20